MAKIELYTRPMCGFCYQAKKLLDKKGVAYVEYDIWSEAGRKDEMVERSNGGSTVPQIFVDDEHVGGCTDLMELDHGGKLDKMLSGQAA